MQVNILLTKWFLVPLINMINSASLILLENRDQKLIVGRKLVGKGRKVGREGENLILRILFTYSELRG